VKWKNSEKREQQNRDLLISLSAMVGGRLFHFREPGTTFLGTGPFAVLK
jgi:hypothetical protein